MTHFVIKALAELARRFYKRSEPHLLDYIATRPLEKKRQIFLHMKLDKAISGDEEADGDTESLGEEEATLTTTSIFMPVLREHQFLLVMEIL